MIKRFPKKIFILAGFIFCFFLIQPTFAQAPENEIPDWVKRIDFGFDFGTNQEPRAYFETVQPLYQDEDKQHTVFIQPRMSYQSDNGAYNLGVGYRRLLDDNNILLGGNLFFDYEDDDDHYRLGIGFEAFVNLIECRLNTYYGLSPVRMVFDKGTISQYERAVDGLDWEVGLPVPYMNWLKIYGGGYWYDYKVFDDKVGWHSRTEVKVCKYMTVNFISYDDNKGGTEFRGDARVSIPLGGSPSDSVNMWDSGIASRPYGDKVDHSNRTLDRVERQYTIEVERYVETATGTIEIRRGDT